MIRYLYGSTRHLALRGVAGLLFGVATLVWPHVTLWALVVLWGAFALVDGATALSAAITDRALLHRGWVAFTGVSGIAAGLVTFFWPGITALALLVVIAAWAFVGGISLIALAVTDRKQLKGEWRVALLGVLSVLLGMLLVFSPVDGALAITWAIGWWACLYGILSLSLAWAIRHELGGRSIHTRVHRSRPTHAMS